MSDPNYADTTAPSAEPAATPTPPTPEELAQEQAEALYAELKPRALETAREFVMRQTPMHCQAAMKELIDADYPPPEPAPVVLPPDTPQFVIDQLAAHKASADAIEQHRAEVEATVQKAA